MHASLPSDLYQHFTYFPLVCIVSSPGTTQNCSRQTSANIGQGRRDGVWIVHKKGCASAAKQFTELLQGAVWSRTVHFLPVPRTPYVFCLLLVPWNIADSLFYFFWNPPMCMCAFLCLEVLGGVNNKVDIYTYACTYPCIHTRMCTDKQRVICTLDICLDSSSRYCPFQFANPLSFCTFLLFFWPSLIWYFPLKANLLATFLFEADHPSAELFWMLRRACLEKESRSSWFLRVGGSSAVVILAGFPLLTVLGTRCGALNTQGPLLLLAILRLISSCNPEFICRVVVIQTRIIVATIVIIIFTCTVIGINVNESR